MNVGGTEVGKVVAKLPSMCLKCPYRRLLQQWLGLWDAGLMKDDGIRQYEAMIEALERKIQLLEMGMDKTSENLNT